jgi:hypothetical protein
MSTPYSLFCSLFHPSRAFSYRAPAICNSVYSVSFMLVHEAGGHCLFEYQTSPRMAFFYVHPLALAICCPLCYGAKVRQSKPTNASLHCAPAQ